jgi:GT2 family glycosyltransferase
VRFAVQALEGKRSFDTGNGYRDKGVDLNSLTSVVREDDSPIASARSHETPTLSIIVVNYRTRDMTLDCLRTIVRETRDTSYEILLVDNASNDGTIEIVRSEMPAVRCLPLPENVGFARANNIAAEKANGRLLLLLNPDTLVLDGAIDRLFAFSRQRPEARIWGGQSLRADRSIDPTSCWRRITLWSVICKAFGLSAAFPNKRLFNPEAYAGWDRLTEREVDIICGCFMLVDRDMWGALGGFDGTFFLYGEEADLCLRAATIGARPTFTPSARIVHFGGASEQVQTDKIVRGLSARAELIARYLQPGARQVGLFVNALLPLFRGFGYRVAAQFSSNPRVRATAETWWAVWQRRSAWRSGFTRQSQT